MLSEKPWKFESVLKAMLVIFGCLFVLQVVVAVAQKIFGLNVQHVVIAGVLTALGLEGTVLVVAAIFLRLHAITWSEAFGFPLNPRRAALFGVLAAILFLPIGGLLQTVSVQVLNKSLERYEVKAVEEQAVRVIKTAESLPSRILFAVIALIFAPLAEEVSFRGIFYPALKQLGSRRVALWVTSVLFALIHSDVNSMFSLEILAFVSSLGTFIPLTILAVVFTELYERTGNLLAPIAAHSAFNGINLLLLFLMPKLFPEMQ